MDVCKALQQKQQGIVGGRIMQMPWMQKRIDPVCKMKESRGEGMEKDGMWFCSVACMEEFATMRKNDVQEEHMKQKQNKRKGCC